MKKHQILRPTNKLNYFPNHKYSRIIIIIEIKTRKLTLKFIIKCNNCKLIENNNKNFKCCKFNNKIN